MTTGATKLDVLRAIKPVPGLLNRTPYITGRVYDLLSCRGEQPERGDRAKVSRTVRRDLRDLVDGDMLTRSPETLGGYGYEWNLTVKGRTYLESL